MAYHLTRATPASSCNVLPVSYGIVSDNRLQLLLESVMITAARSACPINRALEMVGDQWSLLILRDIALEDRRSFRELLTGSDEGISAPVLSRRLTDLVAAGFLTKSEVARGRQGRYSLTELGVATIPLLLELGRLGRVIDPATDDRESTLGNLDERIADLRRAHLSRPVSDPRGGTPGAAHQAGPVASVRLSARCGGTEP
jgi:DNA-binding HxlR family transcriptional regulator